MNKAKKLLLCIFTFVIMYLICGKIKAFEWGKESIVYGDGVISNSEVSKYSDSGKEIEAVCLYAGDDKEVQNGYGYNKDLVVYLFIYKDGTASVGWHADGCARGNGAGTCSDGYESNKQGIRNWSKNSTGTKDTAIKKHDAYSTYKSKKSCPYYLYKAEDFSKNYFYLAYTAGKLKSMESLTKGEPGDKTWLYYNVGESEKIKEDFKCDYGLTKDADSSFVSVTFKKDSYVDVNTSFSSQIESEAEVDGNTFKYIVRPDFVYFNNRLYSTSYIEHLKDGKCPKTVDICLYGYKGGNIFQANVVDVHYVIYGDSSVSLDTYCDGNENAKSQMYCVGDNCSDEGMCEYYDDLIAELEEIASGYGGKSTQEQKEILEKYNTKKDEINAFCLSALSNLDYSEGGCLDKCLKNADRVADVEFRNGIRTEYDDGTKCNVGTSIISMIYNVLKWGKYIAPALVIMLTMLDFIKAISSQNDDDMKKAQSKFIKRLIIAALLFLLPLIINFILQTFGFYSAKCDVTNLFSKN